MLGSLPSHLLAAMVALLLASSVNAHPDHHQPSHQSHHPGNPDQQHQHREH